MPSNVRTLIDYATGENWDLPLCLYERYQSDFYRLGAKGKAPVKGLTFIQYWLTTLSAEEKAQIVKR